VGADGGFSPVAPVNVAGQGPNSNTGQKSTSGGCLVDFLTVVLPASRLEECSATNLHYLLPMIFGGTSELRTPGRRGRAFQFYRDSALIFDREGELCGTIGLDGNADTVCVSLSGAGCRWVRDWLPVAATLETLHARITRVDLAYDDYDGKLLDLHALRDLARSGEGFSCGGRPPHSSFLDDHGSGAGCTLYVGAKGHKQLCVYEKGKEQGDETSPWIRAEVRLYAKHVEAVVLDVLRRPLEFFRAAYPVLVGLLPGVCTRLETVVRTVEATATAMVRWLKNQCGGSINLLEEAIGVQEFGGWCRQNVAREKRPSRFAHCGAAADLSALLRAQLCVST
jgi:phage replication initiation protein